MALSETSPLETALTRIIGEPPVTPATPPAALAPQTSVNLGPAGTSVALGAPQPVTPVPPAPAYTPYTAPAPVAAPAPAPAPAPTTPAGVRSAAASEASRAAAAAAATPAAAPSAAAPSALPWMGYNQYFAGNEAALNPKTYETQYTNQYNQYKNTLPFIYQDLINYGISPEMVASGATTGLARGSSIEKIPTDPNQAMALYGNATTAGSIPDARYTGTAGAGGYQPLTVRDYARQIGMTRPAWQATAQPERQRIRGEYQAVKAAQANPLTG